MGGHDFKGEAPVYYCMKMMARHQTLSMWLMKAGDSTLDTPELNQTVSAVGLVKTTCAFRFNFSSIPPSLRKNIWASRDGIAGEYSVGFVHCAAICRSEILTVQQVQAQASQIPPRWLKLMFVKKGGMTLASAERMICTYHSLHDCQC